MREFRGGSLRRLAPGTRLVYSAFLGFTVLGLVTASLLHYDGLGLGAEQASTYWRGDDAGMVYPKSYRQIVELSHFHLFTEPLTWLVVAHLYNLGGDPPTRRTAVTVVTLATIAGQIALPWLVAYGSAAFAVLFLPVHGGMALGLLYMAGAALREMWWSASE